MGTEPLGGGPRDWERKPEWDPDLVHRAVQHPSEEHPYSGQREP